MRKPERVAKKDSELLEILHNVTFERSCLDMGWGWFVEPVFLGPDPDAVLGWLVSTTFQRPDTKTGEIGQGRGREWLIRVGTTESGIVKTAWLACKQIVEHELMEAFRYKGKRIFDPHRTVEELAYDRDAEEEPRKPHFNLAEGLEEAYQDSLRQKRGEPIAEIDFERLEEQAQLAMNTPPPCPPPERANWLLTPLGSFGRKTVEKEQYEELRGLALALKQRLEALGAV